MTRITVKITATVNWYGNSGTPPPVPPELEDDADVVGVLVAEEDEETVDVCAVLPPSDHANVSIPLLRYA